MRGVACAAVGTPPNAGAAATAAVLLADATAAVAGVPLGDLNELGPPKGAIAPDPGDTALGAPGPGAGAPAGTGSGGAAVGPVAVARLGAVTAVDGLRSVTSPAASSRCPTVVLGCCEVAGPGAPLVRRGGEELGPTPSAASPPPPPPPPAAAPPPPAPPAPLAPTPTPTLLPAEETTPTAGAEDGTDEPSPPPPPLPVTADGGDGLALAVLPTPVMKGWASRSDTLGRALGSRWMHCRIMSRSCAVCRGPGGHRHNDTRSHVGRAARGVCGHSSKPGGETAGQRARHERGAEVND
jgi:hypothetical protein